MSKVWMSVDQSLSHCAIVIWEGNHVSEKYMLRTGSTKSKGAKKKDVVYFDTAPEQIRYIVNNVLKIARDHCIDEYVMEALSLSSIGSATRDLAGLFNCIIYAFLDTGYLSTQDIYTVAPTSVKSFARTLLPEDEQTYMKERVDKKTKKKVYSTSKTVMGKPQMVRACEVAAPGFLDGLTLEAGKADYADAYLIGRVHLRNREVKS